jgi:predicted enzyme related to lactoylglutathione lyase
VHSSRLSTFVIDCRTDDVDAAARFWGAALGREVKPPDPKMQKYRELASSGAEPLLLVQAVDHPGRVHLDIESDDLEAEVRRLEALGARRVGFVRNWWVLEAPTGQRFCVVNPQRGPIDGLPGTTSWADDPAASGDGR